MVRRALLIAATSVAILGCMSETPEPAPAESQPPAAEISSMPPEVGDTAPDFTLTDQSGSSVTLSDARGRPVVLAFYRGHW